MSKVSFAAVVLAAGTVVSAQSLSTGFDGGGVVHSSNPDNGNFFDVTAINPAGITIDSFDIHSRADPGTPIQVHVYTKPGSYIGFEREPSAWTHVGTETVIAAGPNQPTPLPIGGITIPAWQQHGVYVHIVTAAASVQYFTAAQLEDIDDPTNNDARIHVNEGRAINNFFSGTSFFPRGWNGTIYYTVPTPTPLGTCCLPDGSCEEIAQFFCDERDGFYHGDGTQCATTPQGGCPQPPTGACCLPDAMCYTDWEGGCLAAGGIYRGDDSQCAAIQCPSTITTGFTGTTSVNGTYNGNFFDVTAANPGGIEIEAWDVHTNVDAGNFTSVQIWYKQGSWIGNHADGSAWTLLGEYPAISAGQGHPTHVPLGELTIPYGETYGFRIGVSTGNLRYHLTAQMTNPLYNDDVQLDFGAAQTNIFTTNLTNNRGWNGTIYYQPLGVVHEGRCCFPNGDCDVRTQFRCEVDGGAYTGDNTDCATACPQPPEGACCLDNICITASIFACTDAGGIYRGDNTQCADATCHWLETAPASASLSVANAGIFLDLTAGSQLLSVHGFRYTPTTGAGNTVRMQVWKRDGSHVGFDTDPSAWTHHQTITTTSTGTTAPIDLVLADPIEIASQQTVGIYLIAEAGGLRYTGGTPQETFNDGNLTLFSNLVRNAAWGGDPFTPRVFAGRVYYSIPVGAPTCYANCDGSTIEPILTVDDFTCFINQFAAATTLPHQQQLTHYANCDGSTIAPVLNVDDFTCFINKFAQGCP